jgi:SLT domain-containing protein
VPGHDDIFNPVDNIIAGVRYAISRYGSISNVPGVVKVHNGGSYVGY